MENVRETVARITPSEQKERVRTFFGHEESWQGKLYEDGTVPFNKAMMRRRQYTLELLQRLGPMWGKKAIDIGCGCGAYLEELAKKGLDTYGMDLSPEMLRACKERLHFDDATSESHLRCGDVEAIPFPAETFDLVLCVGVFGYLLSDEKALIEIHRILKPEACFLVSVQNIMSLSNIDYVLRRKMRALILRRAEAFDGGPRGVAMPVPWVAQNSLTHHFYKSYNPWRWSGIIEEAGFQKIESMTTGYELRLLRRSGVVPESLLARLEVSMERMVRGANFPYLSHSGDTYIALFRKAQRGNGLHGS